MIDIRMVGNGRFPMQRRGERLRCQESSSQRTSGSQNHTARSAANTKLSDLDDTDWSI